MQLDHKTQICVVDGEKMLILVNEGDHDYPDLAVVRKEKQDNPPDREQSANRRGRTSESSGNRRYAYDDTDFHQLAEDRFAADAADILYKRAHRGDIDKLILIAPPNTLGEIRQHYHKEVEDRLIGEIDKEATNLPPDDIAKMVKAA
ncbi:Host attachment protein [Pacificimonas flava]|uniref:Host attachment protein n=2 Tax=Pacificimonas TaxID=1960290 RepID=A0A219B342_9SPHN|nr:MULTISPECIES: host attachment family protein [Pacificimonas]MBZ6377514.1 host attachment protein [Pacificimonas aurantium]OWV32792.1 Host attachment protein [Pacificimonas flava]